MKILVSAYACEPEKGSEPGVGWNWACQIGRFHEVWVITRANNRQPIEKALVSHPLPTVHWTYFDLPRWACFWKKGGRGMHAYYYLWQVGVYFSARKLHKQVGFDLVHHATFVTYWAPSFLAFLPVPFLWGPVGGGESAPRAFWRSYSLRGKVYETARAFARRASELNPLLRSAARRAMLALATTEQTAARMRVIGCRTVSLMTQVGMREEEISRLAGFHVRVAEPFRVVSIGNLLHLKGFDLGLRAFARLSRQYPASEYWIVGDGPERKRLERLVGNLGVADRVTFTGALPRRETLAKLAECDVLLHPALHESGGFVTLEAMAAGRPVICLDLGGPALQVTPETGIKVPAVSPEQVLRDLTDALSQFASDPELRTRFGMAARKRVEEYFTWDNKGSTWNALAERLPPGYRSWIGSVTPRCDRRKATLR